MSNRRADTAPKYNKKGKEKDLQVVLQGIDLPQPSMAHHSQKISQLLSVWDKVKHFHSQTLQIQQHFHMKLLCPLLECGQVFHLYPYYPLYPVVFQNIKSTPGQAVPPSSQGMPERKEGAPKRKYMRKTTLVRCDGEERVPPLHQQFMGYRYGAKTQAIPFEEWRRNLQSQGVARKRTT
ncbi:uncharacterized protein LOC135464823 [Liolophura sinensis]|uniref:uncharacterized protein LOC135464823 n=1 Tax=Liolophura sinensis TaxID=3198878 RepID=UPI00315977D5